MPRKPRNPGSGKPPHNGPAKGAGSGTWAVGQAPAQRRFTPETARLAVQKRDDPEARAVRDVIRAEMFDVLHGVATAETSSGNERVAASNALLNRIDGMPTQRSEVTGGDGGALVIERRIIARSGS